jgi:hypothetical protein
MKLHRRRVRAAGREFTVLSPRPGADGRFSTNYFHGTWHILSDWHGARLLGRLLWGLAFTRTPDTVVLIEGPALDTDPFEGNPADPILLVPAYLTALTHKSAAQLRHALPHARHAGAVSWRTHGLTAAVAARRPWWEVPVGEQRPPWVPERGPDQMRHLGGFVSYTGSPEQLRAYAPAVYQLGHSPWHGMASLELDNYNGEVQVFNDYRRRVSSATVARRELTADPTAPDHRDAFAEALWHRGTRARERNRFRPFPPAPEPPPPPPPSRAPTPTPYGRRITDAPEPSTDSPTGQRATAPSTSAAEPRAGELSEGTA